MEPLGEVADRIRKAIRHDEDAVWVSLHGDLELSPSAARAVADRLHPAFLVLKVPPEREQEISDALVDQIVGNGGIGDLTVVVTVDQNLAGVEMEDPREVLKRHPDARVVAVPAGELARMYGKLDRLDEELARVRSTAVRPDCYRIAAAHGWDLVVDEERHVAFRYKNAHGDEIVARSINALHWADEQAPVVLRVVADSGWIDGELRIRGRVVQLPDTVLLDFYGPVTEAISVSITVHVPDPHSLRG